MIGSHTMDCVCLGELSNCSHEQPQIGPNAIVPVAYSKIPIDSMEIEMLQSFTILHSSNDITLYNAAAGGFFRVKEKDERRCLIFASNGTMKNFNILVAVKNQGY